MLQLIQSKEIITEKEIYKRYPNSMCILQDAKDPNDVKGIIVAVSTDRSSYRDLCIKKDELVDNGVDCTLIGSYNGGVIGVLSGHN